ncbi:MAG: DUF308 domain-containing protein [Bacteroidota bacterium]
MEIQTYRNWWTYTVKGVFALAFGLISLLVKEASPDWLVQLFGGFIILSGLFLIFGALSNMRHHKNWGLWLFEGLFDIIIGILIIVYHNLRADLEIFFIFVAIWAVSVGFTQLFAAMSANKGVKTRWLLWLNAIIVIVASMVLFFTPYETVDQTLNMIAIVAIAFGVFISVYSFGLKES